MCGLVGIVANDAVNQVLFDALTVLQHRGQDAAGIATCDEGQVHLHKSNGLVREVFHTRHMLQLPGRIGIGHVRYPTAGTSAEKEAQPFYVNSPYGVTLAHNGTLTNADELRESLYRTDLRHVNTNSDSEVILNVLAHELQAQHQLSPTSETMFKAVTEVHRRCRGAYSVIAMITGRGILAFRDPHGIRPLVYGVKETPAGQEYMVASESVALTSCNFTQLGDVKPGEAIYIDEYNVLHKQQCSPALTHAPCIFEYVYLARADSVIEGISVYEARMRSGEFLGQSILKQFPDMDIDVVIPVPETSRSSALSLALALNLPFREGFVKNRYVGRTFIMPGQKIRKKSVRQKLNPIEFEFRNKSVLLVDDSIVRGTTSQEIISMARAAGARKVYFASAAPAIRFPNIYGIDMPVPEELVAHNRTVDEVAAFIGADKLFYLDLDDLVKAVQMGNPTIKQFDCSVFNGQYVTGNEADYLKKVASDRGDDQKR